MLTHRTVLVISDSNGSNHNYRQQLQQDRSVAYSILSAQDSATILKLSQSQQLDGILLELHPHFNNIQLLHQLKEQMRDRCPPIVVIDSGDTETAVQAFKNGAVDYLVRNRITPEDLRLAMRTAIENAELRHKLQQSQAQFQTSVENMLDCFGIFSALRDASGQIVDFRIDYLNTAACENNQMTKEMQLGRGLCELLPAHRETGLFDEYCQVVKTGEPLIKDALVYDDIYGDRRLIRVFDIRAAKLNDGFVASWRDVTERRQTELELSQTVAALQATQQRYRDLAEAMPQIVWTADATGAVNYWNQRWYEYTGLSEAESMGLDAVNAVHPDDHDYTLAQWKAAITNGAPFEIECRIQNRAGQYHWFISRAMPTRDSQGQITAWIGTTTNIDSQKQIQEELRQSEERLSLAMEAAGMGSWDWDIQTGRVHWSANLEQLFGMAPGSFDGQYETARAMIHPDDLPWVEQAIHRALYEREDYNIEFRFIKPDGKVRWAVGLGRVFYDAIGNPVTMAGIDMDITERKQVEAALQSSEERFRNMADNAPGMIWVTDATGYCTYLSKGWYDFTGQTEETGLGFGWFDAVYPDDVEPSRNIFLSANDRHEPFQLEYRLRRHDGTYRWAIDAANPWFGEDGSFKGFIGSVIDMSDRKQAEAALHENEDRLRLALESAELGTWDFNPITNVLRWDEQCKAMFGLPPDASVTYDIFLSGLHPEDRDRTHQVVLQAFDPESGGEYDIEYRTVGLEDGIERWVSAKGKAFFNSAAEVVRFIGTVLNITEKKRAEAEREQLLQREQFARAEAERANRIKDEFLAVLSHELRSPLNPILGWTKLLQTRKFNEAQMAHALATIERNAKLQTELIDDLLDIARILRGKLSLNVTSVNLAFVIKAAIETVKTAAVAKSISLSSTVPNVGQISGDAARLQQIAWNLLSNAIKFTPHGGRVEIELVQVGNQAEITVRDTGKGIKASFLPHIFESFRQEDASITRKYGGLGLGLAIVRQLVEAHGGTVTAESPGEGLGATFTVRLPLLNDVPAIQQQDELPQQDLDLTGIRVLAVDDDPDARDLLAVLLAEYGAEVLIVTSVAEVLARLKSFQPHVLVSDIGMPGSDGYALIQQVRALPSTEGGEIPAIALTAYAREDDQQRAISSGYQQHVTKPLDPERLVEAIVSLAKLS